MTADHMDRRALLRTAGIAGVAAVGGAGLAACGSSTGSNVSMPEVTAGTSTTSTTSTAATGGAAMGATTTSGATGGGSMGGTALGATSDIPNGGGKIFQSEQVVVTQPSTGEFKAFTAVCTHQQCLVNQVSNNVISCPCHGSQFSAKDGSVVQGPAMAPLAGKNISVSGGQISLEA